MAPSKIEAGVRPDAEVTRLAESRSPYLIGVRHHSPVLAAAMDDLLDAAKPDLLLIELPAELAEWLPWLGDPATTAPVALGAATDDGSRPLAFYPFADFSPELAAVRWAVRHGVEVDTCDLPLADPGWEAGRSGAAPTVDTLAARMRAGQTGRADDDMWDRLVEAAAPGSPPEAVRRAALAVGWVMRHDAGGDGVDPVDLAREGWMRGRIAAAAGRRVAAVIGAFHAPALLEPATPDPATPRTGKKSGSVNPFQPGSQALVRDRGSRLVEKGSLVTSLVPYHFALLDARSGYAAGIRDPQWQQDVYAHRADPEALERLAVAYAVRVCAKLRADGHPAGPAEAREVARLAIDLARLRRLPAPGRGELVEAIESVLAQGEVLGRGRSVAGAMEEVFVGDRAGRLAPGTPVSGLVPSITTALRRLRLPGPGQRGKELRLDPLRSTLDRSREVLLRRLTACGVPYGKVREAGPGLGGETLTTVWNVRWTSSVEALIAVAGLRGITLAQATEGALRHARRVEKLAGGPTAGEAIAGLELAAACGVRQITAARLRDVAAAVAGAGSLTEIIAAIGVAERIGRGHVAGTPEPPAGLAALVDDLDAAAVREVDGLAGATELADARALIEVVRRSESGGRVIRLHDSVRRLSLAGGPLIRGAATAACALAGITPTEEFGLRLASWLDAAPDDLVGLLSGALVAAGPLLAAGGGALDPLLERIETVDDAGFIRRLPALRGGFDTLTVAARDRLLETVRERVGRFDDSPFDAEAVGRALAHDRAARVAVTALGLDLPPVPAVHGGEQSGPAAASSLSVLGGDRAEVSPTGRPPSGRNPAAASAPLPEHEIGVADRWRLLLGRQADALSGRSGRFARTLDELYGAGHGEGSRTIGPDGTWGGTDAPYPDVRDWRDELTALYGAEVCHQVLARAAAAGRFDAVLEMDPAQAVPSVELLHTVLSLAGGLPESSLARLRPLAKRIAEELAAKLATRLRPALHGLSTPVPTRRPGGPLDLARTLRANLATARRDDDGRVTVLPEQPIFRSRARRSMDWRVIVLADVSGSMEPSTVWAALTASVLASMPALSTHFVAFSTEVVDLTERVSDPLSLLLEVRVGGGTHIAGALRYARSLVKVPQRTMIVVVSDFEEGGSMSALLAETRALVEAGCRLIGCASLDDRAQPRYSVGAAEQLAAAGMPVAALSPLSLARWVAEQVR